MDSAQIEELRRLSECVPTMPWKIVKRSCNTETAYEIRSCGGEYLGEMLACYQGKQNAAYIIAACNAVPELIERIEELESELEFYREEAMEKY